MAKFEKVNRINEDIKLPERSTKFSAGYNYSLYAFIKKHPENTSFK